MAAIPPVFKLRPLEQGSAIGYLHDDGSQRLF